MTEQQHPITPPPELVQQWVSLACEYEGNETWIDLATQAARWGADAELEACCADIHTVHGQHRADWLRSMRRPKPLTLKEQALMALEDGDIGPGASLTAAEVCIIRRALEQLDE